MDKKRATHVSKFLSLVLRHGPGQIGVTLDAAGWVGVRELLEALAAHRFPLSRDELEEVVRTSEKKRFAFSDDGLRIRASQGHSVEVELGYQPAAPPNLLYHGTVDRFLESIRRSGLLKGERHHVHLSADQETAEKVGQRRGRPVVLIVRAGEMHRDNVPFFRSDNGVWLTEQVPVRYLGFPGKSEPAL
jgi:putative RNA 2'-phosphotransferase